MKIFVMPGHTLSGKGTGAIGYVNEGNENRILSDLVVKYLKLGGADVVTGRLDKAKTSNYLAEQVAIPNKSKYDLVVQIHFNAYKTTSAAMGTETLYYDNSGKAYADRVTKNLGLLYKQRGSKQNQALYWLKNTYAPAILIETCFVDSKTDTDKYICNKEYTAKLIAEGILNKSISEPTTPTPSKEMYRVRKTWQDAKSQKGAYSSLENAKRECNKHPGYSVFNNKGAKVYPNTVPSVKSPYKNGDYDCKAKVVRTNGTGLNVRSSRSASSTKLGNIKEGTIITVNYCKDNWFSTYHLGKLGFISGDYIELI